MADRTPTSPFPDDFDPIEYAEEIAIAGLEKPAAVAARFARNYNRAEELAIARARLASDAADREARNILAELRLYSTEGERQRAAEARERRQALQREKYERSASYQEGQAQYRQERDAQRQAYREEQDTLRQQRRDRAARGQQIAGLIPSGGSGPTVSSGGSGIIPTGGGWAPDKSSVAKFIIIATALGAIGAVANDLQSRGVATKLPDGTKVPAHLRSLGGAFIAGTVALIVNEIYPGAGAVLGAGIVGIIVIPNWTPLIAKIAGSQVLAGGKPKAPGTGGASNLPKTRPPSGGIWEPGGNPGPQPGASTPGPIEVPYGSPSG